MGQVIPFKPKPKPVIDPTIEGRVQCSGCGHQWRMAVPVGTTKIQCPSCHTRRGVMMHHAVPAGHSWFRCASCGNDLVIMVKTDSEHKPMCVSCGTYWDMEQK